MSTGTGIEWTDCTWNPVVGCTRVHAGCDHCYAVTMSHRLEGMGQKKYHGLTVLNRRGDRHFNGKVRTVPEALEIPLKWRTPRKVFVNSMSDLFHKDVPFEFIDRVMAVMSLCPQHTFQVLTKRPERAAEYLNSVDRKYAIHKAMERMCSTLDDGTIRAKLDPLNGRKFIVPRRSWAEAPAFPTGLPWPLSNLWLGCSVSDQKTADEAIPHLLRCPAAVRFVSYEPALGPVDFGFPEGCRGCNHPGNITVTWNERGRCSRCDGTRQERSPIHWVIVGGESGPGARPNDIAWHRSVRDQCKAAGVAFFEKQLGSRPVGPCPCEADDQDAHSGCPLCCGDGRVSLALRDKKGGDWSEWPEDLRVREWPRGFHAEAPRAAAG